MHRPPWGMPLILSQTSIAMGTAIAVGLKVTVPAGSAQEFTNWSITSGPFFAITPGDSTTIPASTAGLMVSMPGYVNRQDQQLPCNQRLLPGNRSLATPAGFVIGKYCWREYLTDGTRSLPGRRI